MKTPSVAILGLGTMGLALARGLLASGRVGPERLRGTLRDPDSAAARGRELGIVVDGDNVAAAQAADVLLVCTEPAKVPALVEELAAASALTADKLLVSIAAGVRIDRIARCAGGGGARIVRVMPNTPCTIGQGMVVIAPGPGADDGDVDCVRELFEPLGRVMVLAEEHLDTVTGLSGSGPAFAYVILEALSEGGVMMGLPRPVATELAAQTVLGAARMVLETGRHPASLKDDVLTPAGCTITALLALEDGRLRSVLARGVQEAARAAARLGGGGEGASRPDSSG